MSGMRWSEEELRSYQARTGAKISSSFGAGLKIESKVSGKNDLITIENSKNTKDSFSKKEEKPISAAKIRSKVVSDSVKNSRVSGNYEPNAHLELTFDGAQMLSTNDLYRLSHFERIEYRKAWHEAIEMGVLQVIGAKKGQISGLTPMKSFRIFASKQSSILCDTDALQGYFKYPIDGLRYQKIILDDRPKNFISFKTIQRQGEYSMTIRVEACDPHEEGWCGAYGIK